MKKNYIGLACTGHDNGLAIVNSQGEIVFAEATERYLQSKRAYNCAPDVVLRLEELCLQYCDDDAEIVIAKSWSEEIANIFSNESELARLRLDKIANSDPSGWLKIDTDIYRYVADFVVDSVNTSGDHLRFFCESVLGRKVSTRGFNHHLTHAATACYSSSFEDAACLIVDGFGEGVSLSCYSYLDGQIKELSTESKGMLGNMSKSIGIFYGHLCAWCGFNTWKGEEWKVMGLAPYGKLNQTIYDAMHQRIRVDDFELDCPESGEAALEIIAPFMRMPDQPSLSAADLAHTGQIVFSELMDELINKLYQQGISENLVLGGGASLNSSYNGKIVEQTPFKHAHIFSAPADDGNAVGAALLACKQDNPEVTLGKKLQSPYLGTTLSKEALTRYVKYSNSPHISHLPDSICQRTAQLIAEGKIIGWVQGRAEFGPRALGNRSILADPRRADMKDTINAKVKLREEFRPFAPSILEEYGEDYFINYQDTPYMERTLTFREEVRERVPAVVHVDGTGRLQSVKKQWNPKYYQLIEEFFKLTNVPILLNTSLNIMGKPIIHSVEDAIAVFYTTGLDALIMEDYLIEKRSATINYSLAENKSAELSEN